MQKWINSRIYTKVNKYRDKLNMKYQDVTFYKLITAFINFQLCFGAFNSIYIYLMIHLYIIHYS